MTNTTLSEGPTGRGLNLLSIAFLAVRLLLALAFAFFAYLKLSGAPNMVVEFDTVGLGQWFRYFTGGCELAGAALLAWPKSTAWGAALLACVSVGAGVAQATRLHGDVIHTVVVAAILLAILWAKREQLKIAA